MSVPVVSYPLDRIFRLAENPRTPPRWALLLVVGAADDGEFYLPCVDRTHGHRGLWWDRRLNLRRPSHWAPFLLTLVTGWFAWIESA